MNGYIFSEVKIQNNKGSRGPRPSSVKDDFRRQGHSEKKKAIPSAQVWSAEMKYVLYLAASNGDLWGLEDTII